MKTSVYFIFFILLSSIVFGATGTSSDGSITDKSSTGASAAAASSSDGSITSTISSGGSGIASSYSGGGITGSPGASIVAATTPAATPTTTTTTTPSEGGNIPSGGGGGSSGSTTESSAAPAAESAAPAETAAESTAPAETAAESAAPEPVVGQVLLAPIEVSATLEPGQSLALSPSLVSDASASLFVTEVTETAVTLRIDTETRMGDMITGGVVADLGEIVVLTIGESVELDTNKDGKVDIKITVEDIKLEEGEYKAYFDIIYYMNDAETKQFVQEQLESGEVRYPVERTWIGIGIILAITILFAVTLIIKVLQEKKRRKKW